MKTISFYCFWALLCLHTTVSFADAATGTIDASLAQVDAIISDTENDITLESAPVAIYRQNLTPIYQTEYTAWELIHRTPMLQGFTWTGEIANFITPAMYIGTPLETNANALGYDSDMGATNYAECVRSETDASFGVDGNMIEATTEDELRNMAKYCATEFLGSYFSGKDYTTREEMLMFLFTMFDEGIELPGYFEDDTFVFDGDETETTYANVSPQAWFAPYIAAGQELDMIQDYETWTIAAKVTDEEIADMFESYRGNDSQIETSHGTYIMTIDTDAISIAKNSNTLQIQDQKKAPEKTTQNISKKNLYPTCDTADIVLGNGQVWSACNVGASKAYSGISLNGTFSPAITKESIGHYFQWGKMIGWTSNIGTTPTMGVSYQNGESVDIYPAHYSNEYQWSIESKDQGPCLGGYHVPSQDDWNSAYSYIGIGKQNKFNNALKLIAEFNLASNTSSLYHEGGYWASTSTKTNDWAYGQVVSKDASMYGNDYSDFQGSKSIPALIRCIKN